MFLVIRGKVRDWQILRASTYLAYAVHIEPTKRVSMKDAIPLPFDDEFDDSEDEDAALFEQGKLIRMPGVKYAGE